MPTRKKSDYVDGTSTDGIRPHMLSCCAPKRRPALRYFGNRVAVVSCFAALPAEWNSAKALKASHLRQRAWCATCASHRVVYGLKSYRGRRLVAVPSGGAMDPQKKRGPEKMPTVTMWKTDHQRCVLIVAPGQFTVEMSEGKTVVRTQARQSADEAVTLAIGWGIDAGIPDTIEPQRSLTPHDIAETARRRRSA